MDDIIVVLGLSLVVIGIISLFFNGGFEDKFKRKCFHWEFAAVYVGWLLGIAGVTWLGWVGIIVFTIFMVLSVKQYGVMWALCAAGYTFLMCALVVTVIFAIMDMMNKTSKKK
jgi:hypothetical protein